MARGFITKYAKNRYFTFICISVMALVIPFLRINEAHLFLLSFDKKELHLFFQIFSMQEMYLMPFVLIILFLTIFFITTLGGRVWCGWICPQTIMRTFYRDFLQTKIFKIRKNISNKQKKVEDKFIRRFFAACIWAFISIIMASNFLWYFVPPEDFLIYITNPSEHQITVTIVFLIATFIFIDTIFIKENFCIYICPYARIQSAMFDGDTVQVIYDVKRGGKIYDDKHNKISDKPKGEFDECIGCKSCVNVCPTHIDIRRGMQLECINCLECADACSNVMAKFNKKSLINWTSKNSIDSGNKIKFFRFRTIGYMVVLSLIFIVLFFVGANRERLLLNINRDSSLYSIVVEDDKFSIENSYIFMIENTQNKDHKFYFSVDNQDIIIKKPQKPFYIKSKKKKKIIVTLKTSKMLANSDRKDSVININIKAFAVDDESISTQKKSIFVYPKKTVIDEKLKNRR
ncbi:cytochrome c oxidase accessory protein CcoG [Campylobacter sp. FMV-PI01]|uniref:Cytochrome c oxidase accessory protein CcoG n=1 Tax=Campylobacter portucalensis TaxID=2608384 RepID=A0A6L5WH65_9BACT|nr:cytochrome c oxidase accessory protein CcoG [Campylobacter portucalensis]MSN95732.1 cytochrome c oxidase accessory protein CcoG [Campylobacter portucalensis]